MLIKSDFWPVQAARIFKKVSHQSVVKKKCTRKSSKKSQEMKITEVSASKNCVGASLGQERFYVTTFSKSRVVCAGKKSCAQPRQK